MIKMIIQKVTEKEKEELGQYYRFEEYIEADQVEIAFLNEQNENKDRTIATLNKLIEELKEDNKNLRIELKNIRSN